MNGTPQHNSYYKNYPVDKKTLIKLQEKAEVLHQGNSAYFKSMIIELFIMLLVAMIIALSINRFLIRVVRVDGSSMFPTFLDNERVMTERLSYNFKKPARKDVIICTYKLGLNDSGIKKVEAAISEGKDIYYDGPDVYIQDSELNDSNFTFERVIKRVIGLPGEVVEISDGLVYINGNELDESAYWNDYISMDMSETEVSEDEYLVVGDNRNNSWDSRFREVAPIPIHRLQGRVLFKIWPPSSIGSFAGKN